MSWYWWVIVWLGLGICWDVLVVWVGSRNHGREKNFQELRLWWHLYRIVTGPVYVACVVIEVIVVMPLSFVYRKLLQKD